MNKLLSICVPAYNRPQLLKRLLKSTIPQAEKHSVPIYINDISTNNLVRQTVNTFNYKYLFYTKNHINPNKKFNWSFVDIIKKSEPKFCWALGHDDIILPKSIDKLLNIIESKPKLELILVNALINNKQYKKYLKIIENLHFTNCIHFFSNFHNKTHFSTPIVNVNLFRYSDTDKYLKSFHLFTGGIWEYLADCYNKNKQNNILVISDPMVLLDIKEEKSWAPYSMYVKYYDQFLWLNLLPKIYENYAKKIYKELLQKRKKNKEILKDRATGQLKTSEIDKLFYYFPMRTKIIVKLISIIPMPIAKILLKFDKILLYLFKALRNPKHAINFLRSKIKKI